MKKIEFNHESILGKKELSKGVKENIIKSIGQVKEITVHICTDENILDLIKVKIENEH